jgi:hypothetical protein
MEVCETEHASAQPNMDVRPAVEPVRLPDRVLAFVDAHRRTLFALVLLLYLLGFNGQWRIERDSALYLSIGRSLSEGHGYTYQGQPQHLAFYGLPLMFAGITKLIHTESLLPDLILMALMGLATLALTYRLFYLHAGRPTAVLMVVGLAASRLFYRYCFELMSDLPFLLGVMAFLTGYEAIFFRKVVRAKWYDWTLLLVGLALAIVMRPAMWVLLLATLLATAWSLVRAGRRRSINWGQVCLGCIVIIAAIAFFRTDLRHANGSGGLGEYEDYLFANKLAHLPETLRQMVTSNIPELCEATLSKALFGCPIGPGVNTLAAILVIVLSCWLLYHRTLWGLWCLLTIGMLLVFKPLDRYLLPVIPLLIFAWWNFLVWLHRRVSPKRADLVFLALLIAGACTNIGRLGQIVVEQRMFPFLAHYHDGRYVSIHEVANLVRQHTRKRNSILVGPKVGRVLTFLSHRNTIKATDEVAVDPRTTPVYALVGPSWRDETRGKGDSRLDDTVAAWAIARGYRLGPQIGPAIQHKPERQQWTLHRIEVDPSSTVVPPAISPAVRPGPVGPGEDD